MAIKCAIHYDNDYGEYSFTQVVIADSLEQAQACGDRYFPSAQGDGHFLSNYVVRVEPITDENKKEYLGYEVRDISQEKFKS